VFGLGLSGKPHCWMLTLTQDAEQAIESIVARAGPPRVAGVRISAEHARTNGQSPAREVRLSLIDSPEHGDEAVEAAEGSRVFLEPNAAELLEDKVLDAEIEGGEIRFSLHEQAD
jgi:iron-sulfur cluster assembly protein